MKSDYIKSGVFARIYRYMQYENALVLRVSLATGLRVGDVLKIRVEDIRGRTIRYTAEKTGKPGKKTVDKRLADELRRLGGGSGFCFKGRLDPEHKHRTRQTVWKDVTQACAAAGIPEHVTPHSARKTYAVAYFQEHGLDETREALQHDRTDTTILYAFSNLLCSNGSSETQESRQGTEEGCNEILYRAAYNAVRDALTQFLSDSGLTISRK